MRLGIWTCVSSWGPLALGHFRTAWIPARHQQFSSRNSHGEDPNYTQLVPINNTAAEVTGTHEPLHHVKVLICCRSKLEMLFVLKLTFSLMEMCYWKQRKMCLSVNITWPQWKRSIRTQCVLDANKRHEGPSVERGESEMRRSLWVMSLCCKSYELTRSPHTWPHVESATCPDCVRWQRVLMAAHQQQKQPAASKSGMFTFTLAERNLSKRMR